MKMSDFIGKLFQARDVAHSVHLNTDSYAQHKALNEFYDDVVNAADAIAEVYMGMTGTRIGPVSIPSYQGGEDILVYLQNQVIVLQSDRYDVCDKDNTVVQNKIDEAIAVYAEAIYKIKFLT